MRCNVFRLEQKGLATAIEVSTDNGKPTQRDSLEIIGHEIEKLGIGPRHTRVHAAFCFHTRGKGGGGALELLVCDQSLDQDFT